MVRRGIIQLAVKESTKSNYHVQLGAVVFKGKRILSSGHNENFTLAHNLHPRFKKWETTIHAEAAAILAARQDLKGADLLVVRVNKNKEFRLAKPCKHCLLYLNYVGIRKVYYSVPYYPYLEIIKLRVTNDV